MFLPAHLFLFTFYLVTQKNFEHILSNYTILVAQKTSSGSGSVRGSGSSSGSASEVEVGEEARGVVWLPDSAAPRCQYCRNHFWLARRRHHCR